MTPDLSLTLSSTLPHGPLPAFQLLDQKPRCHPWCPYFISNPSDYLSALPSKCIQHPTTFNYLCHPAVVRAPVISTILLVVAPDWSLWSNPSPSTDCFQHSSQSGFFKMMALLCLKPPAVARLLQSSDLLYLALSSPSPSSPPSLGNSSPASQAHAAAATLILLPFLGHTQQACLARVLFPVFGMSSASYCKRHPGISSVLFSTQTSPLSVDFLNLFQNRTKPNQTPHCLIASITSALLSCFIFHGSTYGSQM